MLERPRKERAAATRFTGRVESADRERGGRAKGRRWIARHRPMASENVADRDHCPLDPQSLAMMMRFGLRYVVFLPLVMINQLLLTIGAS